MVRVRTHIGFGAPGVQDTNKAHGAPLGAEQTHLAKQAYGWPDEPTFLVPDEVAGWAAVLRARGAEMVADWDARMDAYAAAFPAEAAELRRRLAGEGGAGTRLSDVGEGRAAVADARLLGATGNVR